MKTIAVALVLLSPFIASASDVYVETISSSGSSQVNAGALMPGEEYVLQCSVDTHYRTCATSSCTAVTTDLKIPAGAGLIIVLPSSAEAGVQHARLAIIPNTAVSDTCYLFKSTPRTTPVSR